MKRLLGKKGIVALLAAVLVLSTAASLFLFPLLTSAEPSVDATAEGTWDGKPNIKWYLDNPDASEFEISTPADLLGLSYLVNACARTSRQPDASGKPNNTSDNFRKDRLPSECTDHFLYNADTGRLYVKEDEIASEIPEDAATLNFDIKFWFTKKTVKLTADIDLEGKPWIPIGIYDGAPFQGTFDGADHFVKNIDINSSYVSYGNKTAYMVGFFGYIDPSGTVKNLTLDQETIKVTTKSDHNTMTGGICGIINQAKFANVTVNNLTITIDNSTPFSSNPRCGGFIGYIDSEGDFNKSQTGKYGNPQNIHDVFINGVKISGGSVTTSSKNLFGHTSTPGTFLEKCFNTDGCNNTVQTNYVHKHEMIAVEKKDATCTEVGNEAYWVCRSADPNCVGVYYKNVDGTEKYENFEETVIKMIPHTSDGQWHTDGTSHWNECTECHTEMNKDTHTLTYKPAGDQHYQLCDICQYMTDLEDHVSDNKLTYEDKTGHWNLCTLCKVKINETAHVLSYEKTSETQHTGTCECGYSVTENHDDSGEWKSDATNHWKVCPVCSGEIVKADHTGDLKYAQNDDHTAHYQTCEACGYKSAETEHDKLILTDNQDNETHKVTCETCDLTVAEQEAHKWVWETDSNNPKYEISKCACGAVKPERRLKHTHVPNKVEKKDPTCTEDGNIEYWTCTAEDGECDGKYYTDEECTEEVTRKDTVLKATGHKLTETAAKDATCTAEGNTKYYTCDNCGKYFADDKGENEIDKDSWVTEKTEHVFATTEWSRDAEKHWHECANGCGTRSAETAHTFEKGVCTVCGAADPNYVELDKYEDKTSGAVAEYTDPKADYDEEVVLTVEPVTEEKQEAKDALAAVEKAAEQTFKDAAVYDVTLKNLTTGAEVQPDGQIKVTLKVPDGWEAAVYRAEEDGSVTDMKATMSADGKTVSFVTDHLSTYVLVNTKTSAPATADFILLPVAILLVGTVSGLGILRLRKKSAR